MKTVYFVRHGESEANIAKTLNSHGHNIHLTSNGIQQAKLVGLKLKKRKIDLIVSSPLPRTQETAQCIAKEIGYDPDKIVINDLFIERDWGIYEDGPEEKLDEDWQAGNPHPSLESEELLHKRIKKGLEWLKNLDQRNIILVSHSAPSRAVRVIVEDLPASHMYKLERLKNAEIYEFEL